MLRLHTALIAGILGLAAGLLAAPALAALRRPPANTASAFFIQSSAPPPAQAKAAPNDAGAAQGAAIFTLAPGQTLDREIRGAQKHVYRLPLAEGQCAIVIVEQRGIDVVVRVGGADGKPIAEIDAEPRLQGMERVEVVAEQSGDYQLTVEPKYKESPAGRYQIRLAEIHPASDRDRWLQESRKLEVEYSRLFAEKPFDDRVLPLAKRVLALREKALGSNDLRVAETLNDLGEIYHGVYQDSAKAEAVYRRALNIREQSLGPDHPAVAASLIALGIVLKARGDSLAAEPIYLRALAIYENSLGENHPDTLRARRSVAILYQDRGDLIQAEATFRASLASREKALGPEHPEVADILIDLARVYLSRRDYPAAESLFRRALAIREKAFGPQSDRALETVNSLGVIHYRMSEYAKAQEEYLRVVQGVEARLGPQEPSLAFYLDQLGDAYLTAGDYAKAEPILQRALDIWEKKFGPEYRNLPVVLLTLGILYSQKGDYPRAESFLQRALAINEKYLAEGHREVIGSLYRLSWPYALEGNIARAVQLNARAAEATERNINLYLATGSERQKLAYIDTLARQTGQTISLHVNFARDSATACELAATTIIRRKGRVLSEMAGTLASLRQRLGPEDQAVLDQLNQTTAELARRVLNGTQQTTLAKAGIKTLGDERERLEAEISRRSAGAYPAAKPVTLAAIREAIPADAALIEFAAYRPFDPRKVDDQKAYVEPRYVAYVLRRQGEVQWADIGPVKEVDARVDALRQALADPQRRDVRQLAREVDEKVFQRVRTMAGGSARLLVSPDGELNLIPFGALIDEHGEFLIERYAFTYLTSGGDLLRLETRRDRRGPPVVVADPTFGEPAMIAAGERAPKSTPRVDYSQIFFEPLPGVTEEVRVLKELLPQATFFTKEQATKAVLKSLKGPSILHVATHGFFLQDEEPVTAENRGGPPSKDSTRLGRFVAHIDNPLLRSGLALAGANQGGNTDGILTALEVAGLDLWGTKLVVLSACDTGVGAVKNGEGVYGLRRALVLAGSESQLMSLWPASDRRTRDLIAGYYKALLKGAGRGDALRQAQLRMMKVQPHPYYWASFIQAGEWGNLEGQR